MTHNHTSPAEPLSQYGDRWFKISEKQLFSLMQGWTHTAITDKKPILQTVCGQLISDVFVKPISSGYCEDGIFFDIAPDGDGRNRIYVNFYQAGTFSVEVSRVELERLRSQLNKFLRSHPPSLQNFGRRVGDDELVVCSSCGNEVPNKEIMDSKNRLCKTCDSFLGGKMHDR